MSYDTESWSDEAYGDARVKEVIALLSHCLSLVDSLEEKAHGSPSQTAMRDRVELPDLPDHPHSHQLSAYSHELLRLSGVLTSADEPTAELWRRLDHALTHLDARLNRGWERDKPGKRFLLRRWPVRHIEALAAHFGCTRQAIVRQFIAMCPVESFPPDWLETDRQRIEARQAEEERMIREQLAHPKETP
jgi:hypothetical protein